MGHKSIVFAVNEAGSFAYILPVLQVWTKLGSSAPAYDLVVSPDVENFALFNTHKADLSVVSQHDAMMNTYDLAVCSAANEPNFVLGIAARASRKIAFIDIWSKVWLPGLHDGFDAVAVIDDAHTKIATQQGWTGAVETVGQPAWEGIEPLPEADPNKILFASQPINSFYGMDLGYNEASLWDELTEAFAGRTDISLTYAVHPAEREADLPKDAMLSHNVQEALKTHGTVISAFSSIILDAWLMGRKTISFQPNRTGEDKCYLSYIGAIPLSLDKDTLREAFDADGFETSGPVLEFSKSCERFSNLILSFIDKVASQKAAI